MLTNYSLLRFLRKRVVCLMLLSWDIIVSSIYIIHFGWHPKTTPTPACSPRCHLAKEKFPLPYHQTTEQFLSLNLRKPETNVWVPDFFYNCFVFPSLSIHNLIQGNLTFQSGFYICLVWEWRDLPKNGCQHLLITWSESFIYWNRCTWMFKTSNINFCLHLTFPYWVTAIYIILLSLAFFVFF